MTPNHGWPILMLLGGQVDTVCTSIRFLFYIVLFYFFEIFWVLVFFFFFCSLLRSSTE